MQLEARGVARRHDFFQRFLEGPQFDVTFGHVSFSSSRVSAHTPLCVSSQPKPEGERCTWQSATRVPSRPPRPTRRTSRESSRARLHNSCPAPATFSRNQPEDRHLLKRSQRIGRWASSSCALGALLLSQRTAHADSHLVGSDYISRPLVLPKGVLRLDGGPRRPYTGGQVMPGGQLQVQVTPGDDFAYLVPGAAYGVMDNLELGV